MAQSIIWSGGKPYEYVDGSLQEIVAPQTYTMPDGTRYTYGPDGTPQALPAGQTTAALAPSGTGIGVPQFLLNQGQNVSTNDVSPLGGSTGWGVGDQIYSGSQWYGEPGASPWGSDTGSTFNKYENTPALRVASESGKFSALNGSPYQTLDANGNVTGNANWSNLHDSNSQMTDAAVVALVGAALGGIGAYGGAAGAAGASGSGAGAAGSGAGFVGEGAASGIGAWDGALSAAGGGAAAGAGAGAAASGGGGSGAGFVGEGAASGVPAWDGALANAGTGAGAGAATGATSNTTGAGFPGEGTTSGVPAWDGAAGSGVPPVGAGGSGGSGGMGSGASTTGTPPPANPYVTGTGAGGALGGLGNILSGSGSAGDYAGLLTSLLGAYAGSQGQNASTTSTRSMDPRMDALFYGALAPAALGTMGAQMPQAQAAGQQMMTVGSGLLGQTAPTTATNPYLSGVADDMQRRTGELLGANNLATQGTAVAAGGLGGSRQGVAQGVAAGKAADYLQGNVANLYGTAYAGDQNRLLQQQTLGAGLLSQGLDTQFQPLKNTGNLFSPFNGFGTTTNNAQSGGGTLGALGGALGAAQYGHAAGWW